MTQIITHTHRVNSVKMTTITRKNLQILKYTHTTEIKSLVAKNIKNPNIKLHKALKQQNNKKQTYKPKYKWTTKKSKPNKNKIYKSETQKTNNTVYPHTHKCSKTYEYVYTYTPPPKYTQSLRTNISPFHSLAQIRAASTEQQTHTVHQGFR